MPFDPTDPKDVDKLREAMRSSFEDLRPFRDTYREYLQEMVGVYYGPQEIGKKKAVPINLLELASTIYLQNLLGAPPRVNCSTTNRRIKPAGVKLAQVVNDQLKYCEMSASSVFLALQRAVRSSIGTLGIVKVGIAAVGSTDVDGFVVYANEPFVRHIHIDDWVQDMGARSITEGEFEGHQFEVEKEWAENNEEFDPEARERLSAAEDLTKNFDGGQRSSSLQGTKAAREPFKKKVRLWEIYLPQEGYVVTLHLESNGPALKVAPWEGPPHGPYHKLWYAELDGNSMPVAPASLWIAMHKIVNALYRKLDRQSSRQKDVTVIQGNDQKDAEVMMKQSDGGTAVVQNPAALQTVKMGGIDQSNFAFMLQSRELFSWLAGNLDTLGGLAAGARTAEQDNLMNQNSSQRISMMQQSVTMFLRGVLADYAYYLWEDPAQTYTTEIQIPGYGPIQGELKPEDRQHDFFEHNIEVEPYSMVFQTPGMRAQKIFQVVSQFIMPASQQIQAAGISIDWGTLIREYADAMQLPELLDCIDDQGAPMNAGSAAPQNPPAQGLPPAPQASSTTRNYVRKNVSAGPTPQNQTSRMVTALMGGGLQPKEGGRGA